jgi:SAM-dependent methyltransferase
MDITRLTFSDSTFDSFLCMHVLEHVEDDRSAIRQLFRVLKKGGWGIFGSPIDTGRERTFEDAAIRAPDARRSAFGQHDHVRVYGRDFAGRLREEGFTVQPVDYYSSLPEAERKRFALAPGEDLFVCIKQE